MKKIILPVISLLSISTFAQTGFFLQPEAGASRANVKSQVSVITRYPGWMEFTNSKSAKSIFSYNAGILAGYQWQNWHLNAGLSFMKTGNEEKNIEIATGGWYGYVTYNATEYYYHLSVPAIIAYDLHLSNRFCVSPAIGDAVSYNISSTEKLSPSAPTLIPETSSSHTLSSAEFHNYYKRLSDWGIVRLQAAYKLNNHISITAGPEAQFMISNFWNNKTVSNAMHNYCYTFNAGIMWHLKNKKASTSSTITKQS